MEDGPAEKLKSPMESLEYSKQLNVEMGPGMCLTSVDWFTLRLPFPFQVGR